VAKKAVVKEGDTKKKSGPRRVEIILLLYAIVQRISRILIHRCG